VNAIAAIGNLSLDRVAGGPPRPGGPVFYAAPTLARLNADARLAASCAADDLEHFLPALGALGLPFRWYAAKTTTAYSFHYEGDRRIMSQEAVGDAWSPARALEAVGDATWIHVGALVRSDFPEGTLVALAADGRRLLVDAQGLVRTGELGALRMDGEIGAALECVSILKLDEEEAVTLAGSSQPETLQALGVPEVLLTLGSRGSVVVTPGGIEVVPAEAVMQSVDPTGAGDTFCAAYLSARAGGTEPVEAAVRATAVVAEFLAE
jgi:sugar/nucleoside kinase (ribokinase family)